MNQKNIMYNIQTMINISLKMRYNIHIYPSVKYMYANKV